ncbi:MAG: DUF1810 domain-containing protein, partial [Oscillospiraceae bacterium]|nr:DUF1810 domain-containing protein [Oscillospiraceae bacterium]
MAYDLSRFHKAQQGSYETALAEIRSGRKRSHWIWYIFPQIQGLGFSSTAQYYAIENLEEAKAYLADPVLRERLLEISNALLALDSCDPSEVMGYPDDLKLRSSMTLFSLAEPECTVFRDVLDKFYNGQEDSRTIAL